MNNLHFYCVLEILLLTYLQLKTTVSSIIVLQHRGHGDGHTLNILAPVVWLGKRGMLIPMVKTWCTLWYTHWVLLRKYLSSRYHFFLVCIIGFSLLPRSALLVMRSNC